MARFRPLAPHDLDALERWFAAPHARAWYGESRAQIDEHYARIFAGTEPIRAFVVEHEGRDVGLFEWVRLGDFPEIQAAYGVDDPDMANCDVILGEPDVARRGLGPRLIRQFLTDVVFADPRITGCVIDPESDNAIAIRAYEKAGFRFVRAVAEDTEGGSVHLLELRCDELAEPVRAPDVWLRPARADELGVAIDVDADACAAFAEVGIDVSMADDHPFTKNERARWSRAIDEGRLLFACTRGGEIVGFAAFGLVDGRPFLHQLSVRRAHARRGVGAKLLARVVQWAVRPGELWLTTYDHLRWNRPWYQREGFRVVERAAALGPELSAIVEAERALPDAQHRVVMVRSASDRASRRDPATA